MESTAPLAAFGLFGELHLGRRLCPSRILQNVDVAPVFELAYMGRRSGDTGVGVMCYLGFVY